MEGKSLKISPDNKNGSLNIQSGERVCVVGRNGSGKSTLINELVGQDVQRTGQAPTDDSFTIITSDTGFENVETPGSTL